MHLLEAGRIPTQAIASLRTGTNKCATALVDGLAAAAAARETGEKILPKNVRFFERCRFLLGTLLPRN